MSISLKKIAKECGVSVSTASRSLSIPPSPKISVAVRERIKSYASLHGYIRNDAARSLRLRRHESVILALPPYFSQLPASVDFDAYGRLVHWELIFSVIRQARHHGYSVSIEPFMPDSNWDVLLKKVNSTHSDGAIFIDSHFFAPVFTALRESSFPFVALNFQSSALPTSVYLDITPGYRQALEYLFSTDKKRLALCIVPHQLHAQRIEEVLEKLCQDFAQLSPPDIFPVDNLYDVRNLASSGDLKDFDAIFCQNDVMAAALSRELSFCRNTAAPLIIGYDNLPIYSGFSSIGIPLEAMAYKAIDLLIASLQQKTSDLSENHCFQTFFLHRNTN